MEYYLVQVSQGAVVKDDLGAVYYIYADEFDTQKQFDSYCDKLLKKMNAGRGFWAVAARRGQ